MTAKRPPAPKDLAVTGRAFWVVTVGVFDLNQSEARLLHECCRILDELDDLRAVVVADGVTSTGSQRQPVAHPALAAMSSHRGVLGRLLAQLNLPYDEDSSTLQSPVQVRSRRAASVRWANSGRAG